jgi:regulator of protease activity HflC (stomatin/prohibitin superfamily)
MITVLWILAVCTLIAGLVWGSIRLYRRFGGEGYDRRTARPRLKLASPIVLTVFGMLFLILMSGSAQVPATHLGVVENTLTGQLYILEPGTHIWPFTPKLVPLITKVTVYDLRRQIIEIGGQPVKEQGVQADSESPGRPVVYFYSRGWAYPNPAKLLDLHRRYGESYLDTWVERVWVSQLKAIQGSNPYDYVGNFREAFQDQVEKSLQQQLMADDEQPLVFVSQLAVVDFDYDDTINAFLSSVAQKEFERQQAEQQVLINKRQQEATLIAATTAYSQTVIAADGEREKLSREAEGRAAAQKKMADASAYQILAEAKAKAEGILAIMKAIGVNPDAYLRYATVMEWDGKLPNYMFGNTPLPFMSIPSGTGPQP